MLVYKTPGLITSGEWINELMNVYLFLLKSTTCNENECTDLHLPGRFTNGPVSLVVIILGWAVQFFDTFVLVTVHISSGYDQGQTHRLRHIVLPLGHAPTIAGERTHNLGLISVHPGAWQSLLINCLLTIWLVFGTRKANLRKTATRTLSGLGLSPAAQRQRWLMFSSVYANTISLLKEKHYW